jgi:hypothetical protein
MTVQVHRGPIMNRDQEMPIGRPVVISADLCTDQGGLTSQDFLDRAPSPALFGLY